ncbi:MAG: mechanosensitive ion channel family protein [Longimicrobiales bacterium]|nr:mechanosensitive ion channel family protein [Longimicrobiales bacterium]
MTRFFDSIVQRLAEIFDPEILGATAAELLANTIIGAATFAAYYAFWRILDVAARPIMRRARTDETTRDFVLTILKFTVLALGVVNAMAAVGVNTASLIASLGIAGLTLGFAARDALSNLISGLLIFWDRPFVIGDLVELGESYGRVDRITLRSTRVVTPDGRMLAIPNTEIINRTVASYTNFPHLRISVSMQIGVNENIDGVRAILLGLVADDDRFMEEPAPRVPVTATGDYNVTMELQAWVHDERAHGAIRADLRERAYKALTAAGVDMPFETLRIEPLTVREGSA